MLKFSYGEDEVLEKVKEYIGNPNYNQHYPKHNKNVMFDLFMEIGAFKDFARCSILKYVSRYDRKGSKLADLMKAIHYLVVLYALVEKEENVVIKNCYDSTGRRIPDSPND